MTLLDPVGPDRKPVLADASFSELLQNTTSGTVCKFAPLPIVRYFPAMPVLRNPQWEKFANQIAKGETQMVAYERAGYPRHHGNANRLAQRPEVQARVAEILEKAANRANITVDRVVQEIGDVAFEEMGLVGVGNKLKALELLGRWLGIFQDNLNVTSSSDLANRMREAQRRMREKRRPPMIEGSIATPAE